MPSTPDDPYEPTAEDLRPAFDALVASLAGHTLPWLEISEELFHGLFSERPDFNGMAVMVDGVRVLHEQWAIDGFIAESPELLAATGNEGPVAGRLVPSWLNARQGAVWQMMREEGFDATDTFETIIRTVGYDETLNPPGN